MYDAILPSLLTCLLHYSPSIRLVRILGIVYSIIVGFVIIVTGNHYFVDIIVATAYCSVAAYSSKRIVASSQRWRWVDWLEQKYTSLLDCNQQ